MPVGPRVLQIAGNPVTIGVAALAVILAVPLSRWLASRYHCQRAWAALLTLSIGAAVALASAYNTTAIRYGETAWWVPGYIKQLQTPGILSMDIRSPLSDLEEVANYFLYIPIGISAYLVLRKAFKAISLGLALTVAVETAQSFIGRAGDINDILHNGLGAVTGTLIGTLVILSYRHVQRSDVRPVAAPSRPSTSTAADDPA